MQLKAPTQGVRVAGRITGSHLRLTLQMGTIPTFRPHQLSICGCAMVRN